MEEEEHDEVNFVLNDFHHCYLTLQENFQDYLNTYDNNLLVALLSLIILTFSSIILYLFYSFCYKKIKTNKSQQITIPTDEKEKSIPSPALNRKSNGGLESFASAQAQRLSSKMTPEPMDKKQKSPYSTLIDGLPNSGRTPLPSDDEDASTSSSSSDELSLPSNHKRSDLSYFRKNHHLPQPSHDSNPSSSTSSASSSSANKSQQQQYNAILQLSIHKPEVLIGWKIEVPQYGRGVVLDFQKKKFRSTKYRVLFENQKEKLLKLKRSDKKGKIPFTFIESVEGIPSEK